MTKLTLQKISPENYQKLVNDGQVDKLTIYWLTNGTIYNNGKLYGGNIEVISQTPAYPEFNVLYIDSTTLEMKKWNGTSFDVIGKGYTTTILDSSNDDLIPTAKAVALYVEGKIASSTAGVSNIASSAGAVLSVTKNGTTESVNLNGVAYSPSYDETTKTLTIPYNNNGTAASVSVTLDKEMVVTAGKYNSDTKEIWLSIADDGSYTDPTKVIKIPVGGLIDVYTGKTTTTTVTTVTDNQIGVDVRVSTESGNLLSTKTTSGKEGLYVGSDASKLDKVAIGHTGEIISANADGTISVSGKSVGSSTLASTPNANTVATEAAVKAYADSAAGNALTSAQSYADGKADTAETNAKNYADGIIEWVNF